MTNGMSAYTTSTAIARRPSAMSGELPELPIFASSDSFTVETGGRLVNWSGWPCGEQRLDSCVVLCRLSPHSRLGHGSSVSRWGSLVGLHCRTETIWRRCLQWIDKSFISVKTFNTISLIHLFQHFNVHSINIHSSSCQTSGQLSCQSSCPSSCQSSIIHDVIFSHSSIITSHI